MEMSNDKNENGSRCSEPGRDVVTGDNVWLLGGREGEDGYPGREYIRKGIHL
jgi:hypothetical protein